MAMTLVVTRNVKDRIRGFLASCMCEVGPGVYVGPRLTPAVRERIWGVLPDWFEDWSESSIVMIWPDHSAPGGQAIKTLGSGCRKLHEHDGVFLARGDLSQPEIDALTAEFE